LAKCPAKQENAQEGGLTDIVAALFADFFEKKRFFPLSRLVKKRF